MELSSFFTVFFSAKGVSLITAFLCGKPELALWLWRASEESGIRVRIVVYEEALPELEASGVWREGILLDLSCNHTEHVLAQASEKRAFNHRYTWLLIDHSPFNRSYLEEVLTDTLILPDADVTWSSPDALAEMYRVKALHPLLVTQLSFGRNVTKQYLLNSWAELPSKTTMRKNLNNISVSAATVVTQPQYFKGWTDLSNRYVDTWPKITYPLMKILAKDINIRYNLMQVDLYGEEHNGSFDGIAGRLQRKEVEIGICALFMRNDRWRVLHYSSEITDLKGAFMFRQPSQSTVSNMFLLPFSRGVWAASLTIFAGVAVVLALVSERLILLDPSLQMLTPMETFMFAIGTICQQGFYATPELISIRIMMLFTFLTSLFVFTSYSAKIVAILQSPSNAIQTIEDITRSPMGVGVQETTYKKTYFAESSEPATQALYRKKLLPLGDGAYMSAVEGIERMRTGLFAFQAEEASGYDVISKTFTESEKCGLQQIQAFKLPMVAVPIKRYSGYRELMAVRLRWHREVGLISQQRRIWLAERPRCDASSGGGFVSVGLLDVTPAAQTLMLGHFAAVLSLFAEILTSRFHKLKNYKSTSTDAITIET